MKRTNKKGGAAIVAVLIVIMLVAVGRKIYHSGKQGGRRSC